MDSAVGTWEDVRGRIPIPGLWRIRPKLPPLPVMEDKGKMEAPERTLLSRTRLLLRAVFLNPALLLGTALVAVFIVLAVWGNRMTEANPYELHGVMIIEGEIGAPPYAPSSVFPWGTDHLGRDVQALVLSGAKQTLTLAFLGMLARLLLGATLGLLAGWWRGGWFDRLVTGAVGVWAAFPATLFAMLLIQALGIKQGMWVFVLTMAVVGWGEVAQFVRGQVIAVKPELYIEAARSMGARAIQILTRHVLPYLVAPLLVLAALETGGILMLLSELGFLNIFLGGGFKVMYAETGHMVPVIAHFSDIPEWGALLANIREWWRSYPWMAWYAGVAFFLAIVAFNLFGEGLRRFLQEGRINLGRVVNRYTVLASAAVIIVLVVVLQSAAPIAVYQPQAMEFDAQRAMEDIRVLSSPEFEGRETGRPGAERAAQYIAGRMREIGLLPAGEDDTFLQSYTMARGHLLEVPRLEILDDQGNVVESLVYRQDFAEYAGSPSYGEAGEAMISNVWPYGERRGQIVGLALGPYPTVPEVGAGIMPGFDLAIDPYGLKNYYLDDRVVVVREEEVARINMRAVGSVLIVTDDPLLIEQRYLHRGIVWWRAGQPVMYVTLEVADRLLATAGSSLAELDRMSAELGPGEIALTDPGATVDLDIVVRDDVEERYYNVIGFIPGIGAEWGVEGTWMDRTAMDGQVIVVSAYYDGLGIGPDGTLYPGANDNASGVAAMLEIARVLKKEGSYQPKKTVVFIAWAGGERAESLSLSNVMTAKIGFDLLNVEAIIELSGVGAGTGSEIALAPDSSSLLVQFFQDAAGRVGATTTTRGRDPHYNIVAEFAVGGRQALNISVSWDGSDRTAHTAADAFEAVDPEKLGKVGRTTLLMLTFMSREDYLDQFRE